MNFPSPSNTTLSPQLTPRVDFDLQSWINIINQKGVDTLIEKSVQCPCKVDEMNAISNCQNCGGSGWVFVNPRKTRIVLQGMGIQTNFESWSKTTQGIVNFSCMPEEKLKFMDRITRLNAISIYNQVLSFKQVNTTIFAFATYNIKEVESLLLYTGPTTRLQLLTKNTDFIYENNIVKLVGDFTIPDDGTELTASITYYHHPAFHILDVTREAVDNFVLKGNKEQVQQLPVRGIARRAHNIADMENLAGNRLLNNDFTETTCNCDDL